LRISFLRLLLKKGNVFFDSSFSSSRVIGRFERHFARGRRRHQRRRGRRGRRPRRRPPHQVCDQHNKGTVGTRNKRLRDSIKTRHNGMFMLTKS